MCFLKKENGKKNEKIREWADKRGGWREEKNIGWAEWWLATANGPQAASGLLNHTVCVCMCVCVCVCVHACNKNSA